jgi:ATP-dependent RNA helicase DeaD
MSHEIIAADAGAARAPAQPSSASDSVSDLDDPRDAPGGDPEDAVRGADQRRFADLDLDPEILQGLEDMGYERPMPVQLAVYGPMSAGRDIMVQSRTGSGKTSAFGIPIAQRIDAESKGAQALILAPTRELALQVSREIAQISIHKGLRVQPIYGGAPIKPQIDALQAGAQVISGTPGRVLDHLRRGTLKPGGIRTLVLDECDEMLSMGFQEEIEKIIEFLPPKGERQTVLFSATIPDEIQRIARRHMNDPEEISLSTGSVAVEEISHFYYVVSGVARTRDLLRVLRAEAPDSAIIFCNTREETNTVAKFLQRQGYDAEAISSDLTQRDRERVMKRMRDRNLHFLVATDVAARGIDISDLSHVINYTFPESPEVYVHRTGRTGRAGKSGVAISLVGPRELGSFYYLKLIYKIRPEERDLPTPEEMGVLHEGERYERVAALVREEPGSEFRALARRVWQSSQGERIVGALVQRLLSQHAADEAAETVALPTREPRIRDERPQDERPREERDERRPGRDERREARSEDRDERRRDRDERRFEDRDERRRDRDERREARFEDRDDRRRDRGERRRDRDEREGRRDRDERREARGEERGREDRAEARHDERPRDERPREARGEERGREDRAEARREPREERPREARGDERGREERREARSDERGREARGEERREARSDERGREERREARSDERGREARGEERREARGDERREAREERVREERPREERREARSDERGREARGEERREARSDERGREARSDERGREPHGEERREASEERIQDERPRDERAREERTEERGDERREARGSEERRDRREERRREKEARREEREARRKERREERRRRGEESDERGVAASAEREGVESTEDERSEDFGGAFDRDADRVASEPARTGRRGGSETRATESTGTAWPAYDELDDEAKEFWETWADEKAERRQAAPSQPRNGERSEARGREAAPTTTVSRSRNGDRPAPSRARDEAPSRTRETAPASTRDEAPASTRDKLGSVPDTAPARPRDTARTRARDEAPARARDEAPARARDEAPARVRDEAPARVRDEAPARARDEAPARVRDTAAARDDEDIESTEHGGPGETARLYVNVGKREGLSASDVRRLLGEGVSEDMASRIGSVALRNTHCYVRVPEDIVDAVIAAAAGKSYEDRELVIERARR